MGLFYLFQSTAVEVVNLCVVQAVMNQLVAAAVGMAGQVLVVGIVGLQAVGIVVVSGTSVASFAHTAAVAGYNLQAAVRDARVAAGDDAGE